MGRMMIPGTITTQAIDSLLKWKKKKKMESDSEKAQLLPEDDFIYLILTLKKIPPQIRINPNKLPLPHPLVVSSPATAAEICLIIDDSNLTSKFAKQKITDEGICVTKVIKLSKLKTDYKPFESKRKLCDSYDMFFADKRVIPLLPKLLGKQFFKKKKLPLGVDLTHNNWKQQIERGFSSGLLYFRSGTCCVIRVAKISMERDQIIENVSAAVDGAIEFVPKKLLGVRSFHLKFSDSVALPLYQSLPDIKLRIQGVKEGLVEGFVDGDDEAQGMEVEEPGSVEVVKEAKVGKKSVKDKKRKGDVVEVNDVKTKSRR